MMIKLIVLEPSFSYSLPSAAFTSSLLRHWLLMSVGPPVSNAYMVLILDGNLENAAHIWGENRSDLKKTDVWLFSIQTKALNRTEKPRKLPTCVRTYFWATIKYKHSAPSSNQAHGICVYWIDLSGFKRVKKKSLVASFIIKSSIIKKNCVGAALFCLQLQFFFY